MSWYDAHNHLHDPRIASIFPQVLEALQAGSLAGASVNGTHPGDWPSVRTCCEAHPGLRPQYGLHPWWVNDAPVLWRETLEDFLAQDERAGIGEIGLDRWKEGHDLARQVAAFRFQLGLASKQNRPVTIHCLKAWGALRDELKSNPLPERGFLLHSYGGPQEMVKEFLSLGAMFSLSAYFAHPRKADALKIFAAIPIDRLLLETDAPDMCGPTELNTRPFIDVNGECVNHPLNIDAVYRIAGDARNMGVEELRSHIQNNYLRFFGN